MYTSKNTSVNANRPAAIYKKLINAGKLQGKEVLDYGCGKYFLNCYDAALAGGCKSWTGYDPYWKPQNLLYRSFDVIVCANVLNVIRSEQNYEAAIIDMFQMLNHCGAIYIQIYAGDRSGIGRETKPDCWQRNENLDTHLNRIFKILLDHDLAIGVSVRKWNGLIVIRDNIPF